MGPHGFLDPTWSTGPTADPRQRGSSRTSASRPQIGRHDLLHLFQCERSRQGPDQYIDLVPEGPITELLERQIIETAAYLAAFTPEQANRREAPEEWNVLEIVVHVVDVEWVSSYRALRIARADPVMWTQVACAVCAPSRTTSRATSDIPWPTFAGNTAGSYRQELSATRGPAALRARRRRAAAASSPSGKSPWPAAPRGCSPPTPSGPRRCSAAREEQVGSAGLQRPEHRIEWTR